VPVFDAALSDWASIQAAGQEHLAQARYGWQFRTYYPSWGGTASAAMPLAMRPSSLP